ncbi:(2Fe-2S) ferredoxin domain-containing protein [Sphingomonas sp. Y38-1Y]|uniref:(2Fe-2S) ferredoxin domain-containing protein n=1 Tax=Sphingomonas sp. Y38-1Y TaxID=3078265 RepID=UPI0028E9A37A|nr:(2Fe-2S) ferredoxin domain-containing protein [Sphingomonas sp. Y38-1Y]
MKTELRSNWSNAVLVCAKCSKRVDGGFGDKGRTPLAKALRRHLKLRKGRKGAAGVVEVKCLGVCPRDAVVVVNGAESRTWHLVRPASDLDEVAAAVGLSEDRTSPERGGGPPA